MFWKRRSSAAAIEPEGRAPRYDLRVRVDLRSTSGFTSGVTENLSTGGLFVATAAPCAVGEIVRLTLRLMHAPPMELRGEVRWLRPEGGGGPPGMGLRLLDLSDRQERVIDAFLRSGLKPLVDRS